MAEASTVIQSKSPYIEAAGSQILSDTIGRINPATGQFEQGLLYDSLNNQPRYTSDGTAEGQALPRVQDFSTDQKRSFDIARSGIGAYQPYLQQATQMAGTSPAAYTAASRDAADYVTSGARGTDIGGFLDSAGERVGQGIGAFTDAMPEIQNLTRASAAYGDMDTYRNPYTQQVMDTSLREMNRQHELDQDRLDASAVKAGAFGGTRHGVAESEMLRGHDQNRNQFIAQLMERGYTAAQAAQEAHRVRQSGAATNLAATAGNQANLNLQGAQAYGNMGQIYSGNEGANLDRMQKAGDSIAAMGETGANINFDASRIMSGIGGLNQQYGQADVNLLNATGSQQQQLGQLELDQRYNQWQEDTNRPFQLYGWANDMLNSVPSSQSTMTSNTAPSRSNFATAVGGIGQLATAGNQFGWWGDDEG